MCAIARVREAIDAFNNAARTCPTLDVELFKYAEAHDPDALPRVLRLLTAVSDGRRLLGSLMPLLRSENPSLRSQAVLLAARGCRNPDLILKLANDPDPRVRANVIEGIRSWNMDRQLLERALADPHHRVACNALLTLLLRRDPLSDARLREFLRHKDWQFRAAASWAAGESGRAEFYEDARALLDDPERSVRWNALRAMSSLRRAGADFQPEQSPEAQPEVMAETPSEGTASSTEAPPPGD